MTRLFQLVASAFESTLPLPVQQRRLAEGVRATVADPFWMLSRQWQLLEFRGSSGGSPLEFDIHYCTTALTPAGHGGQTGPLPLQARVEAASGAFDEEAMPADGEDDIPLDADVDVRHLAAAPAWRNHEGKLEYAVTLEGRSREHGPVTTKLAADEYRGGGLDWYEFRAEQLDCAPADLATAEHLRVRPTAVTYPGMPRARYWDYEDHEVRFGDLARPGNFLSMMLLELGCCYSNDWFTAELPQPCNTLRRILQVRVRDVFDPPLSRRNLEEGQQIPPHENRDDSRFQMFALEPGEADVALASSRYHLLTDVHPAIHAGPSLEEVVFFPDEAANLYWSVERVARAQPIAEPAADAPPEPVGGSRHRYQALELPPRNYIPYLSTRVSGPADQLRLRRGRTVLDPFHRQYQTQLVGEMPWLCDDELPGTPIAVVQQPRLACMPGQVPENGHPFTYYLWVGRKKSAAPRMAPGRFHFDVLR